MAWTAGIVIAGYGVASGRDKDSGYPEGTIALQKPYFLEKGVDLSLFYPGTLNVDLSPLAPIPGNAIFDGVLRWHSDIEERFLLVPIQIRIKEKTYAGLWYYPHPDTKPAHFQKKTVVELLLPWIDGIGEGEVVQVKLPDQLPNGNAPSGAL